MNEVDALVATLAPLADGDLEGFPPAGLGEEFARAAATNVEARVVVGEVQRGTGGQYDGAPRRPRRGRLVAVGSAVVVLAVVWALAVVRIDSGGQDERPARVEVPPTVAGTIVPSAECGSAFPQDLAVPDGFSGPRRRVSETGQLILEWRSATGTYEVRWPADDNLADPLRGRTPEGSLPSSEVPPATNPIPPLSGSGTTSAVEQLADGQYAKRAVYKLSELAGPTTTPRCETFQWIITDSDSARVDAAAAQLTPRIFRTEPFPLVAETREADVPPPVTPCNSQPGALLVPNVIAEFHEPAVHVSPREALRGLLDPIPAFDDTIPTIPHSGYIEYELTDGTYAYARQSEDPSRSDTFIVVARAEPIAGGWAITKLEHSGC